VHFGFAGEGFPLLSLPKTPSGIWFVRRGRIGASSGVMFAILHVLGSFACDLLKSRRRLQAENLFLRHQLNIAGCPLTPESPDIGDRDVVLIQGAHHSDHM
jgi:hypothetical protein